MAEVTQNVSEERGGRWPRRVLPWLLAILLFYPLSFGPVDRLFGVGSPVVRTIYTPLLMTYKSVPPFRRAFDVYMGFWDKHW